MGGDGTQNGTQKGGNLRPEKGGIWPKMEPKNGGN